MLLITNFPAIVIIPVPVPHEGLKGGGDGG